MAWAFRVECALTSAPDDPNPVWDDITQWVLTTGAGSPISITRGRQDELAEVQPSTCSLTLDNTDHRWTPGNTTSPVAGQWRKGRRIRVLDETPVTTQPYAGAVADDPGNSFTPGGPGTASHSLVVPAATGTVDITLTSGDDLDLYLYLGGVQVAASANVGGAEQVTVTAPAAGTYTIWVHGYAVTGTGAYTVTATVRPMPRFDGYITDIAVAEWALSGHQVVNVAAADRLGRLADDRPFHSTIGSWLARQSRPVPLPLVAHWPLTDPDGSFEARPLAGAVPALRPARYGEPTESLLNMSFGGGKGPPADDQAGAGWDVASGTDGVVDLRAAVPVTLDTTKTLSIVVWVETRPPDETETFNGGIVEWISADGANSLGITYINATARFYVFAGDVNGSVWWSDIQEDPTFPWSTKVPRSPTNSIAMLTARWRLQSPTKAWLNGDGVEFTATDQSGTAPATMTLGTLRVGGPGPVGISHLQVYVTDGANDWTLSDHLEQHQVGYLGYEGDTTSQRISRCAELAGVPADLVEAEATETPMQRARLAGRTMLEVSREAEATEHGLLFVDGLGRLRFHGRRHRYGQTPVLVPMSWLSGGLEFRFDDVLNDYTVTQRDGLVVTTSDEASITEHGVHSGSVELAVLSDGHLQPRADWMVGQGADPGVRAPGIEVDLLTKDAAARQTLLALELGTRIDIADLPATAPAGAGSMYVEGIAEEIGVQTRRIRYNTSPAPTTTFHRIGTSTIGGPDPLAY